VGCRRRILIQPSNLCLESLRQLLNEISGDIFVCHPPSCLANKSTKLLSSHSIDSPASPVSTPSKTAGKTCPLLLVTPGGRTSEPATVWGDARPDRSTAGTDGIDGWTVNCSGIGLQGVGGREVVQKRRNIGQFRRCGFGSRTVVGGLYANCFTGGMGYDQCRFFEPKRRFRITYNFCLIIRIFKLKSSWWLQCQE